MVGALARHHVHRPGDLRHRRADPERLRGHCQWRATHAAADRARGARRSGARGERFRAQARPPGNLAGDRARAHHDHDRGGPRGHGAQRGDPWLRGRGENGHRAEDGPDHPPLLARAGRALLRGFRARRRSAHRHDRDARRAQEREVGQRGRGADLLGHRPRGLAPLERAAARHHPRAHRAGGGERHGASAHAAARELRRGDRLGCDAIAPGPLAPAGDGRARPLRRHYRGARTWRGHGPVARAGDADVVRHAVPSHACRSGGSAGREPMSGATVPTARLLEALPDKRVLGTMPAEVRGVAYDSRKVEPGEIFVAIPGLKQDGRRYVEDALARGASAVVLEGADPLEGRDVPRVLVSSSREALARLADAYFGHPSGGLIVVGITGTNGKTTTSYLVDALLAAQGRRTGIIGTVQYRIADVSIPAGQTTPEALETQSLLRRMHAAGVTAVAMEVSSHALALSRVDGIDFDVAVFTNLTQDHLDFHMTMDAYREAKRRLFRLLAAGHKPSRHAVVNADDPSGLAMVADLPVHTLTYGVRGRADVRPTRWSSGAEGIRMNVRTPAGTFDIASPLVGEHNVENLLAATGVGIALGMEAAVIARALGFVASVPGRFERVEAGQPFLVVVDYAHTPDALERTLETARKLRSPHGRLAVVFGCGGDRDRGKRPIMGEIAARLADHVWVTSDNPRSERPDAIIDEILVGVRRGGGDGRYTREVERRRAIGAALDWARSGDTVLIAGKGHETYQIIGAEVLSFDDREVARQLLQRAAR